MEVEELTVKKSQGDFGVMGMFVGCMFILVFLNFICLTIKIDKLDQKVQAIIDTASKVQHR